MVQASQSAFSGTRFSTFSTNNDESCSRQIRGWTNNLQNSDIKGQRHLNDRSRRQYEFQRSADEFNRHIDEVVRRARPQDYPEEDE